MISMVCDRITWPCGCDSWLQFESGTWVRKYWHCLRHHWKAA